MNRTLQDGQKFMTTNPAITQNSFGFKRFSSLKSETPKNLTGEIKVKSSRGAPRPDGMLNIPATGFQRLKSPAVRARMIGENEIYETKMTEVESRVYDMKNITVPRNLKYSSRFEDNDLDVIR